MEHQDHNARKEGLGLFLTPPRVEIIDKLEELVFWVGSTETAVRIGTAAEEVYEGNHHVTQLLTRKNMKQCEYAEALLDELRAGRCTVAYGLTRTLLEGAVELSWAAEPAIEQSAEDRLLRILRRQFEGLTARGSLPPAEAAVLQECHQRDLKLSPESARNAMEQMDAAEKRTGGEPYWESHYAHFKVASDFIHASLLGPGRFTLVGNEMHVDMNPNELEGVASLRWGLFYFVRGADAVFRLVELTDDATRVTETYRDVKEVADRELDALLP